MKKRQCLQGLAAGLWAAGGAGAWGAVASESSATHGDWAASTRALGAALLAQQAGDNTVIAPLSIWGALAMLFAGARGDTALEMASALKMPNRITAFAQGWQQAAALHSSPSSQVQLRMANRLWVQKNETILPDFEQVLRQAYAAELMRVPFADDPEAARQDINTWVAQQTEQHIPTLLAPDTVTPFTRLVLGQAVYFKAAWSHAFERVNTRNDTFTLAHGQTVQLPFMHQAHKHRAGQWQSGDVQAQLIELPYADEALRMLILVPRQAAHLPQMLDLLRQDWRQHLSMRHVTLSLPRWKVSSQLSLQKSLTDLGLGCLFDPRQVDLSGVSGRQDLVVSAVVHQAMVDVSEQGTEAAAATAVVAVTTRADMLAPPMDIRVDRPYAWAIVDTLRHSLLFAGVVRDPR